MKNKRKTMTIAMFVSMGLLVLSGFANAASISGYTAFKDGVRATLDMRNATVILSLNAAVDGVLDEYSQQEWIIKADLDQGIKYTSEGYGETYYVKRPGLSNPNNWVRVWKYNDNIQAWEHNGYDSLFDVQPEWIRIVEILGDALSGSAKDYFFVSRENGLKTVTARLDQEQVPEIVDAVIHLMHADSYYSEREYIHDPDADPNETLSEKMNCGYIKNVEVTNVSITTVMDENDIIQNGSLEVTLLFTDQADETNEGVATFEFTATQVGTTVVTIPDIIMEKVQE